MPQPSALAPRGVDWFVFPSVTLRNPEKLKCESFMLRERRGQQASQERNSERVLFPKLMERTSEALFQQRTLYWGSSRREAGEANTSFQSATKAVVARGQDELRKGLFIQCC